MKSFHYANLANNLRLQRLHDALKRRPRTTREIRELCDSCSPATLVSELRHNGIGVKSRYQRTTDDGGRVYVYTLDNLAPGEAEKQNRGLVAPGGMEAGPGALFSRG